MTTLVLISLVGFICLFGRDLSTSAAEFSTKEFLRNPSSTNNISQGDESSTKNFFSTMLKSIEAMKSEILSFIKKNDSPTAIHKSYEKNKTPKSGKKDKSHKLAEKLTNKGDSKETSFPDLNDYVTTAKDFSPENRILGKIFAKEPETNSKHLSNKAIAFKPLINSHNSSSNVRKFHPIKEKSTISDIESEDLMDGMKIKRVIIKTTPKEFMNDLSEEIHPTNFLFGGQPHHQSLHFISTSNKSSEENKPSSNLLDLGLSNGLLSNNLLGMLFPFIKVNDEMHPADVAEEDAKEILKREDSIAKVDHPGIDIEKGEKIAEREKVVKEKMSEKDILPNSIEQDNKKIPKPGDHQKKREEEEDLKRIENSQERDIKAPDFENIRNLGKVDKDDNKKIKPTKRLSDLPETKEVKNLRKKDHEIKKGLDDIKKGTLNDSKTSNLLDKSQIINDYRNKRKDLLKKLERKVVIGGKEVLLTPHTDFDEIDENDMVDKMKKAFSAMKADYNNHIKNTLEKRSEKVTVI